MTVRLTYTILIDGYVEHPEGEVILHPDDWARLKQYNVAIGRDYISSSSSGGSVQVSLQILESKGARFTKTVEPPHSAFVSEDE